MTTDEPKDRRRFPVRYATAAPEPLAVPPRREGGAREPVLHFVAGLPRSGATALLTLLHQNPRIHAAPVSGLGHLFHDTLVGWEANPYHAERVDLEVRDRVLRAILRSYHDTDRPIILDKQRMWMAAIPFLEELLGRRVKVIAPVRPLDQIVASFEVLRRKTPDFLTSADVALGRGATVRARAEYLLGPEGTIGLAIGAMRGAIEGGYGDRVLFVDYNRFTDDPAGQLERIYGFLEERPYAHDLEHIQPLGRFDSRSQGFVGLHDVRPALRRASVDPREVLGPELAAALGGPSPWDAFTG
jgi:sulfotransferase